MTEDVAEGKEDVHHDMIGRYQTFGKRSKQVIFPQNLKMSTVLLNVSPCQMFLKTVSRCCTRGESEDHIGNKAYKGSTLALKPRADTTRSPKRRPLVTSKNV